MAIERRAFLAVVGTVLASPTILRATEPSWPTRPITMVVASAAGGALDATGRVLQPRLSALLGESIVIDNRGGGGGVMGVEVTSRAAPDGHTLLLGHLGALVINGLMRGEGAVDSLAAFEPISLVVEVPSVLVVPAERPWRTLNDLIAAARAKPGALSWGHSGVGSTNHLSGALLDQTAGIQTVGIPYRGGAPLALDLVAGRLDFSFATSASIITYLERGLVRAIAIPSLQRSSFLPDVPTVAEAAGLTGFEVRNWYGLLAPKNTPAPVLTQLNVAMRRLLTEPETISVLRRQGLEPTPSSPEEFTAQIISERRKWAPVVRASGVRVD
jgi:tripartite-type tricarboxylate transporter receptor subunit TctC